MLIVASLPVFPQCHAQSKCCLTLTLNLSHSCRHHYGTTNMTNNVHDFTNLKWGKFQYFMWHSFQPFSGKIQCPSTSGLGLCNKSFDRIFLLLSLSWHCRQSISVIWRWTFSSLIIIVMVVIGMCAITLHCRISICVSHFKPVGVTHPFVIKLVKSHDIHSILGQQSRFPAVKTWSTIKTNMADEATLAIATA